MVHRDPFRTARVLVVIPPARLEPAPVADVRRNRVDAKIAVDDVGDAVDVMAVT